MRISFDITRTMGRGLLLTCVILLLAGGWSTADAIEQDWLDAMVEAVLVEQTKDGTNGTPFVSFLGQLTMVRAHLINGESEAVYRAMNRLDVYKRQPPTDSSNNSMTALFTLVFFCLARC